MLTRIGYVEDDPTTRKNYTELFEQRGYEVEAFSEPDAALASFTTSIPDVVLLDLELGGDKHAGFSLCQSIRKLSPTVPIVFLTGSEDFHDEETGFILQADDYVTKGVKLSDRIVVRIQALLGRRKALDEERESQKTDKPHVLDRGSLEVRCEEFTCYWKGERVQLTLTEYWILEHLAKHPGSVKSSVQLQEAANIVVQPNTINSHISRIRRAFKEIDPNFKAIITERRLGFRWLE